MTLEYLNIEEIPGKEDYSDNMKWIYVDKPSGFNDAKEFLICLPGCPLTELTTDFQEFLSWYFINMGETVPKNCYGIYNIAGLQGFAGKIENNPIQNNIEWNANTIENVRKQIISHYTKVWQPNGEYQIFTNETTDNGNEMIYILRYSMSDKEAEEIIAAGGLPSANILVTLIYVNKSTGKVHSEDEYGDNWFINFESL